MGFNEYLFYCEVTDIFNYVYENNPFKFKKIETNPPNLFLFSVFGLIVEISTVIIALVSNQLFNFFSNSFYYRGESYGDIFLLILLFVLIAGNILAIPILIGSFLGFFKIFFLLELVDHYVSILPEHYELDESGIIFYSFYSNTVKKEYFWDNNTSLSLQDFDSSENTISSLSNPEKAIEIKIKTEPKKGDVSDIRYIFIYQNDLSKFNIDLQILYNILKSCKEV